MVTELDLFLEGGVQDTEAKVKDPIEWWRLNEHRYPILSKMAFDLFTIPSMSAECERVFSHYGIFVTPERNQLLPHTIKATMC